MKDGKNKNALNFMGANFNAFLKVFWNYESYYKKFNQNFLTFN